MIMLSNDDINMRNQVIINAHHIQKKKGKRKPSTINFMILLCHSFENKGRRRRRGNSARRKKKKKKT